MYFLVSVYTSLVPLVATPRTTERPIQNPFYSKDLLEERAKLRKWDMQRRQCAECISWTIYEIPSIFRRGCEYIYEIGHEIGHEICASFDHQSVRGAGQESNFEMYLTRPMTDFLSNVSICHSTPAKDSRSRIKVTRSHHWDCDAAQAAKTASKFRIEHSAAGGPFCPAAGHAGCSAICGHRPIFSAAYGPGDV